MHSEIVFISETVRNPCLTLLHIFILAPLAAELSIDNEYTADVIAKARAIVAELPPFDGPEAALRNSEAGLHVEIVSCTHKIDYLLKFREFVVLQHKEYLNGIESRRPAPQQVPLPPSKSSETPEMVLDN